jgi:hypothetical protein
MNEPTLLNSATLVCGLWTITPAAYALWYARSHESHFAFAPIECQALLGALKIDAEFRTPSGAILIRPEQPFESQLGLSDDRVPDGRRGYRRPFFDDSAGYSLDRQARGSTNWPLLILTMIPSLIWL